MKMRPKEPEGKGQEDLKKLYRCYEWTPILCRFRGFSKNALYLCFGCYVWDFSDCGLN